MFLKVKNGAVSLLVFIDCESARVPKVYFADRFYYDRKSIVTATKSAITITSHRFVVVSPIYIVRL